MTFYRPDLHSELKRLCLLQSSEYQAPKLLLGSEVISVVGLGSRDARITDRLMYTVQDIDNATVTLANGSSIPGDLIIGADGERVSMPKVVVSHFAKAKSIHSLW
jgi:salicylate hydroxylase